MLFEYLKQLYSKFQSINFSIPNSISNNWHLFILYYFIYILYIIYLILFLLITTKLFYSNCEYILFSLLKYLIPTSLFLSDYNRFFRYSLSSYIIPM